ncbi:MAG: ABC transporter ATP-binding protein, partial [Clostridiales bacterium]|nr:ABC transporter ATP-binding protein [Clostridiales bacterium]
ICGKDVVKDSREIKKFTGYIPSDVRFYGDMTVGDLLRMSNGFYSDSQEEETERLCQLFELDRKKKFHELSLGNKKKVAVVSALAATPKVLILDEPTNGLDPMMQKILFTELKNQSANGVSILLSSHNLGEVQEYCHRVAFIKKGGILAVTDLKEIRQPRKIVTTWGGKEIKHPELQLLDHKEEKRIFRYTGNNSILLKVLQEAGLEDFTVENESLEERFMELYGKEEQ